MTDQTGEPTVRRLMPSLPLPLWRFPHILLRACQMNDAAWSEVLHLSPEQASAWLDGELELAEPANERLLALHAVLTALGRTFTGAEMARWLQTPHPELGHCTPLVWLADEADPDRLLLAARRQAAIAHGIGPDSPWWPAAAA